MLMSLAYVLLFNMVAAAQTPILLADARIEKAPEASPAPTAAELAERVQSFYEHTQDFKASFTQRYQYKAMGRTQTSSGTVEVKKPGFMRWDYAKPHEKLFLLDGKSLWIWDPADEAVVVNRSFSSDQLSAAVTFLWGKGKLADEFEITRADKPAFGDTVLELVPRKPQSGFTKLYFGIDAKTGAVVTSVVIDSQGNENRIEFTDPRTNTNIPASRFKFEVPKGATVQEL